MSTNKINFSDELGNGLTIHKNMKQDIIVTTEDKMKLNLIKAKELLNVQKDWWTPLGLLITSISTLCTSDFKDIFGVKKEFWSAVYFLIAFISLVWLVISLYKLCKHWGEDDVEKIIEKIKLSSENSEREKQTDNTQNNLSVIELNSFAPSEKTIQ